MAKQKPEVHKKDGFWLEWFRRRGSLDVDIYTITTLIPGGAEVRGELITKLEYPSPRGRGLSPSDFEFEAISIAKDELEKKQAKAIEQLKEQITSE